MTWSTEDTVVVESALLDTSYQIRITFVSSKKESWTFTYGFQGYSGETIRVVYYGSRYESDVMGIMSKVLPLDEFRILMDGYENPKVPGVIKPKFFKFFSRDYGPLSDETKLNQKRIIANIKKSPKFLKCSQPKTEISEDPLPENLQYNRLGWLVDSDNWVYDPKTKSIFGVISSGNPIRFFYSQIADETPTKFYHVKALERPVREILSKAEFSKVMSEVKKGRPARKS